MDLNSSIFLHLHNLLWCNVGSWAYEQSVSLRSSVFQCFLDTVTRHCLFTQIQCWVLIQTIILVQIDMSMFNVLMKASMHTHVETVTLN